MPKFAFSRGGGSGTFGLVFGVVNFLLRINREEHVMIETVSPMIAVVANVEIDVCALGQPKVQVFLLEMNRPIFGNRMFSQELYLLHWAHKLGLDTHNLKRVRGNPCASLQIDGVGVFAGLEPSNAARPIFPLPEMHEPCGLPLPLAQALAGDFVIDPHIGKKQKR